MPSSRGGGAASQAGIGQAPGDLATLQAFVNTLDIEQGTDLLSTPASCDQWLLEAGLRAGDGGRAKPRDLATALELREALRGVLRSHVAHSSSVPSGSVEHSGPAEPLRPGGAVRRRGAIRHRSCFARRARRGHAASPASRRRQRPRRRRTGRGRYRSGTDSAPGHSRRGNDARHLAAAEGVQR